MPAPAQRIPTFEELYEAIQALPDGITGEILSDGVIETMARPGRPHRRAWEGLFDRLRAPRASTPRRWRIESEAEVRLFDRLTVPDLSGWQLDDDDDEAFLDENPIARVPDWTCEILSPSTERKDRTEKLPLYALANVGHVWLVDPEARSIEVYVSQAGAPAKRMVAHEADIVALPPFDLDIDLASLWVPRPR